MSKENPSSTPNDDRVSPDASDSSDRKQLIEDLNKLLEAERAGTRVAIFTAKDARSADLMEFLSSLKRDEARWCDMLTRNIEKLGGTPTLRCGDFYDKAMAIGDIPARLDFLNRGQEWVVRRLDDLVFHSDHEDLILDLQMMRDNHLENIAATTRLLERM